MASFSKTILIGHLGGDVELRYTQNQTAVANFNIATTKIYKEKKETTWHKIIVWGKLAENCSKYLSKGKSVLIEGEISHRQWTDKDGVKRTSMEITANNAQFLSPRPEGADVQQQSNSTKQQQTNDGGDTRYDEPGVSEDIPF